MREAECTLKVVNNLCSSLIMRLKNVGLNSPILCRGGGEVLGISSDGDDRMEPKVKTQKNP